MALVARRPHPDLPGASRRSVPLEGNSRRSRSSPSLEPRVQHLLHRPVLQRVHAGRLRRRRRARLLRVPRHAGPQGRSRVHRVCRPRRGPVRNDRVLLHHDRVPHPAVSRPPGHARAGFPDAVFPARLHGRHVRPLSQKPVRALALFSAAGKGYAARPAHSPRLRRRVPVPRARARNARLPRVFPAEPGVSDARLLQLRKEPAGRINRCWIASPSSPSSASSRPFPLPREALESAKDCSSPCTRRSAWMPTTRFPCP